MMKLNLEKYLEKHIEILLTKLKYTNVIRMKSKGFPAFHVGMEKLCGKTVHKTTTRRYQPNF